MLIVKNSYGTGILLVTLSYLLFSSHDALIKILVVSVTTWQILFFRSSTVLIGCLIIGGRQTATRAVRSSIIKPMAVRSIFLIAAWISYYTAAKSLQLGQLTTIYFAAPVVATLLAGPMLGETVSISRWLAVIIGFVGVVVASDPAGLTISLPVYLVFQAACLWAFCMVLLRRTAMHETSLVQMIITNFFFVLFSGGMVLMSWTSIDLTTAGLLAAVGVIGGLAQFTAFEAMRRAPVSVLAPFEYSSLVWAFVLGYLIWGDIPALHVAIGAVLIGCAGLIIIFNEKLGRKIRSSDDGGERQAL